MSDNFYSFLIILVCSFVTIALRALPFVLFRKRELPRYVRYIGDVLPFSVMAMLVVYCLKEFDLFDSPFGIPEIAASLCVVVLHVWRRNTLLSIVGGTALYMLLIQFVAPNFL